MLLALVGGLLGTALAAIGLRLLRGMTLADLPRVAEIRMDGTVLGFALAISLLTGILFGLIPSLIASRPDLAQESYEAAAKMRAHRSPHAGLVREDLLVDRPSGAVSSPVARSIAADQEPGSSQPSGPRIPVQRNFDHENCLAAGTLRRRREEISVLQQLVQHIEVTTRSTQRRHCMDIPDDRMGGISSTVVLRSAKKTESTTNQHHRSHHPEIFSDHENRRSVADANSTIMTTEKSYRQSSSLMKAWHKSCGRSYPNGIDPVGQDALIGIKTCPDKSRRRGG